MVVGAVERYFTLIAVGDVLAGVVALTVVGLGVFLPDVEGGVHVAARHRAQILQMRHGGGVLRHGGDHGALAVAQRFGALEVARLWCALDHCAHQPPVGARARVGEIGDAIVCGDGRVSALGIEIQLVVGGEVLLVLQSAAIVVRIAVYVKNGAGARSAAHR